jgi:hypothetical protein
MMLSVGVHVLMSLSGKETVNGECRMRHSGKINFAQAPLFFNSQNWRMQET